MRREILAPRLDWPAKVETLGLDFHTHNGAPYWWEGACYAFSAAEIDAIEEATETLHALCLEAVGHLIDTGDLARLDIPPAYWRWIGESWRRQDPDVYGRFDLAFDGTVPPKMLEYNADTPTALIEASVVQWYWLQDLYPERDQFNSLHEKLIARWELMRADLPEDGIVHFSCVKENAEDLGNLDYLRDVATQAGIDAHHCYVEDLGWDPDSRLFIDNDNLPIRTWFKLYPWEWLVREE